MKILIPAVFLFSSFYYTTDRSEPVASKYSFCTSRAPIRQGITNDKTYVLYSDIKEIADDTAIISKKTREWRSLVDKVCANADGCTSDHRFYDTYDQAKREFDYIVKRYSDTSRFILRKISF